MCDADADMPGMTRSGNLLAMLYGAVEKEQAEDLSEHARGLVIKSLDLLLDDRRLEPLFCKPEVVASV